MQHDRHTQRYSATAPASASAAADDRSPPTGSHSLRQKLALRTQQLAAESGGNKRIVEGDPQAGHGTALLRRKKVQTVTAYPVHEQACLNLLRKQGIDADGKDCVGADELLLTEDHMIVRFDMHVVHPDDHLRHRYLVDVDMSMGQMADYKLTHLGLASRNRRSPPQHPSDPLDPKA